MFLLVVRLGEPDRLFLGIGDEVRDAQYQVAAKLGIVPVCGLDLLPPPDHLLGRAAGSGPTADDPLDAVLRHEVQGAVARADYGLPALHRQIDRPRHQGYLLERVASVRHLRRDCVVLAMMRERLVVERLEQDLYLLLEQLAVLFLAEHRRAERLDLARVVAAPNSEDHPATGQDVGGGVVLSEPQRVPHWSDVETAAELDLLGKVRQVHTQLEDVRDALVALRLEVVLRHPEIVVAKLVLENAHGLRLVEDGSEPFVGVEPVIGGSGRETDVLEIYVSCEQASEFVNHGVLPSCAQVAIDAHCK